MLGPGVPSASQLKVPKVLFFNKLKKYGSNLKMLCIKVVGLIETHIFCMYHFPQTIFPEFIWNLVSRITPYKQKSSLGYKKTVKKDLAFAPWCIIYFFSFSSENINFREKVRIQKICVSMRSTVFMYNMFVVDKYFTIFFQQK